MGPVLSRDSDDVFLARYGPVAVVTGAARGIGAGFARALARRGLDLVLTDIDGDGLESTSAAVEDLTGRRVTSVELDMAEVDAPSRLVATAADVDVGLVICNHLMPGARSRFLDADLADLQLQLEANVGAYIQIAHAFGNRLRSRGRGGLIMLSSLTAVVGAPYVTMYGASKAFVLAFGSGLGYELERAGVDMLTLVPGSVDTETYRKAEQRRSRLFPPMAVDRFVDEALGGLGRRRVATPGWRNRLTSDVLVRLLPRQVATGVMGRNMERMLDM